MQERLLPSYPLITCDPYFSLWCPGEALNQITPVHWTGIEKPVLGTLAVDGGAPLRFWGIGEEPVIAQKAIELTATATRYTFETAGISLQVEFLAPLLLDDLDRMSTPVAPFTFSIRSTDGAEHSAVLALVFDEAHTYDGTERKPVIGNTHHLSGWKDAWMGRRTQTPLGHSGDHLSIDWGYLHLTVPEALGDAWYDDGNLGESRCAVHARLNLQAGAQPQQATVLVGYDDIHAIQYFGDVKPGYWARHGKTILQAIPETGDSIEAIRQRCAAFDAQLQADALALGGEDYYHICIAAYRQVVSAHKLIEDNEGNLIFLSKECHSNGCIGTVDISYPSIPLFLLYRPELVVGMLRPVFKFAGMPVWPYDFAPHDVGRYPYATGQVYGSWPEKAHRRVEDGETYPMFYQYPAGDEAYVHKWQMPVEESGNMLIIAAATALRLGSVEAFLPHLPLLERWLRYLLEYGEDPGEQLCTDDFAGHLAHNVNLSAKAVMGVEAYAQLLRLAGRGQEADDYHAKAQQMAESWLRRSTLEEHTALTFEPRDGWSLKYNLIWDILFGSGLFPKALFATETAWYLAHRNRYGTPLDSRKGYTKSDWILWTATMMETPEDFRAMITPVAEFLRSSPDRVPFSDFYESVGGEHLIMQHRPVQGGVFMPLLRALFAKR